MKNEQISVFLEEVKFPYKVQYWHKTDNIYVDFGSFITEYESICCIDILHKNFPDNIYRLVKVSGVVK